MKIRVTCLLVNFFFIFSSFCYSQRTDIPVNKSVKLTDIRLRDGNMLANPADGCYYFVTSMVGRGDSGRKPTISAFKSKNLIEWEGPFIIFVAEENTWEGIDITGIWAPEIHFYKGKYYIFTTFNTSEKLCEQWIDWEPRVIRGSVVLVSDSPLGPFRTFSNTPMLPADMMTLDGTLIVEDEIPYMVYCHEWVQLVNGTIEVIQMKDDLTEVVGQPRRLFWGSSAPWKSSKNTSFVTDGPSFHKSRSGKLFMIWSSFSDTGYTTGIVVSESGKISGPWHQKAEPLYTNDGGHGFIFTRFDGQLMLVLHQPNSKNERFRFFELEDTGETLKIMREYE